MFIQKFPSGPLDTNAILFACNETKKAAVIDPSAGSTDLILKISDEMELKIEQILLTHSHWDHIADVHLLKEKTGASVFIHRLDAENLKHPGSDGIPLFFPIHGVEPDGFLEEGKMIQLGKLQIEVIHTPGHSPGSICFYLPAQKMLFSGDTLFQGSIGNLHLPTGQPKNMWGSLRKLAALPLETRVVPGHGGDTILVKETWLSHAEEIFSE
jgi:glyoxylase-like metal-dependent hydrolase (beta-lactamase superfamily II)